MPVVHLVVTVVSAIAWLAGALLFVAAAWGLRGEPKPFWFDLWAVFAWLGWAIPLATLVLGVLAGSETKRST